MEEKNMNPHFLTMVMMFAQAAWQHLGKTPNPMSGKTERELSHAQMTIDLLIMLQEKTKGNLTPEEEKMLGNIISDLQFNYADEAAKETKAPAATATPSADTQKPSSDPQP